MQWKHEFLNRTKGNNDNDNTLYLKCLCNEK